MTTVSWSSLIIFLAVAVAAVLAVALWRKRRESDQLKRRLESAAAQLESLQKSFSKFAPREVVERSISHGLGETGEKKDVTVLFADLVGFTALSETVEPAVLVGILNGYFERMSHAITQHRGYVSTFIGDGILALFGALAPNPWQANDAVHAALAMRDALETYNRELAERDIPTLAIGVGLNRGVGVAGLVGSRDLMEYAFVGRTVNVAARVQDLTRQYEADIIITESLCDSLDPRFALRRLEATRVKGVAKPLSICAVDGFDGSA